MPAHAAEGKELRISGPVVRASAQAVSVENLVGDAVLTCAVPARLAGVPRVVVATPPEGAMAAWKVVTLVFCMMVGTASLPHILMRYFTTPSVKEARDSVAWSLLFIFLLYFSAPAYAAFSKLEVYTNIIGRGVDGRRTLSFAFLANGSLSDRAGRVHRYADCGRLEPAHGVGLISNRPRSEANRIWRPLP